MFCLTENDNGMKIKSNIIVLGEWTQHLKEANIAEILFLK